MSVIIRCADNGWILKYTRYLSTTEEIYSDEERMLTRVHQLVSKWDVDDRVSILKKTP